MMIYRKIRKPEPKKPSGPMTIYNGKRATQVAIASHPIAAILMAELITREFRL